MADLETKPTTILQKINASPVAKFGGGGLALLGFLGSVALAIWTNVPPLLLVGFGAACFAAFLFLFVLHLLHNQRQPTTTDYFFSSVEHAQIPAKQLRPPESKKVAPAIHFVKLGFPIVTRGSDSIFRETFNGSPNSWQATVAEFQNEVQSDGHVVKSQTAKAQIYYFSLRKQFLEHRVLECVWLDDNKSQINVRRSDIKRLLLTTALTNDAIGIFDNSPVVYPLIDYHSLFIYVRLTIGKDPAIIRVHRFKLTQKSYTLFHVCDYLGEADIQDFTSQGLTTFEQAEAERRAITRLRIMQSLIAEGRDLYDAQIPNSEIHQHAFLLQQFEERVNAFLVEYCDFNYVSLGWETALETLERLYAETLNS